MKRPEVGHNDVLIKIRRTAICGTDIHIWKWDDWAQKTIPVPMHVGHEYVGEIVEMGQEVRLRDRRSRVRRRPHHVRFLPQLSRGRRHLCRNTVGVGVNREGAFAEYLAIPAFNAFKIPPEISDDLASIFDPFGNATHTALSFNLVGEDVLITGAPDRHHGRRDREARRRAQRRHHRYQRLPARTRAQDGRDACGQRRASRCAT